VKDAITPPDILAKLLAVSREQGLVLVGGQALAFWMSRYDVHPPRGMPAISRDTDFLALSPGDRELVARLARVIHGSPIFPPPTALTALVGQAVKPVSADEQINVDVIFKIHGADESQVRRAAVEIEGYGTTFRVMHPLHVLKSRLDNLYSLKEKQADSPKSEAQLRCAIRVVQRFLIAVASEDLDKRAGEPRRSATLHFVKVIERFAKSDAGRKTAARHHIHVADAIEPRTVADANFLKKKLPQLLTLMSTQRRMEILAARQSHTNKGAVAGEIDSSSGKSK
jgi:hypothetical protein